MEVAEIRGGIPEGLRVGDGSTGRDPPAGVTLMKGERDPNKTTAAGAPFALLHGHRACQGVCQGFPGGAPKRRVLDRHPRMLNTAEMRAKGNVWKGGVLRCGGPPKP